MKVQHRLVNALLLFSAAANANLLEDFLTSTTITTSKSESTASNEVTSSTVSEKEPHPAQLHPPHVRGAAAGSSLVFHKADQRDLQKSCRGRGALCRNSDDCCDPLSCLASVGNDTSIIIGAQVKSHLYYPTGSSSVAGVIGSPYGVCGLDDNGGNANNCQNLGTSCIDDVDCCGNLVRVV
jgi:hypothetical protein